MPTKDVTNTFKTYLRPGTSPGLITTFLTVMGDDISTVDVYSSFGALSPVGLKAYIPAILYSHTLATLDRYHPSESPSQMSLEREFEKIIRQVNEDMLPETQTIVLGEKTSSILRKFLYKYEHSKPDKQIELKSQLNKLLIQTAIEAAPFQDKSLRLQIQKCLTTHDLCLVIVGVAHAKAIIKNFKRPDGLGMPAPQ